MTVSDDGVRLWEVDSGLSLSPPLPRAGPIARAWFDDEHHLAMLIRNGQGIWTRDLTPDGRPASELRRLAWLLSGRRIDDVLGPVPVESAALGVGLGGLARPVDGDAGRAGRADGRLAPPARRRQRDGRISCSRPGFTSTRSSRPRRTTREPGHPPFETYRRRGEILARLGEWDRAASDFGRVVRDVPFDLARPRGPGPLASLPGGSGRIPCRLRDPARYFPARCRPLGVGGIEMATLLRTPWTIRA